MISINEIEKFYPENQRPFKRNLLKEYLQYEILRIIFSSEFAPKLSLMGGTCLRIVLGTNRFSEDLDFDNFGITKSEFENISENVASGLKSQGYEVEIKIIHKGAFRCYIRIPGLLYNNRLSGHIEEKILIQLDSEAQNFVYKPKPFILNKFDIIARILYTPESVLLSQKIWAILNRKTAKGRDFYDTMFLLNITKPDFAYLTMKANIKNSTQLKKRLIARINSLNLKQLSKDLKPFIINQNDINRIELFPEFLNNLSS